MSDIDIGDEITYEDDLGMVIHLTIQDFREFEIVCTDDHGFEWRLDPADLRNGRIRKRIMKHIQEMR
jgi:hypothetical protein